ncbi:MAG: hypothetical protein GX325_00870 [Peptococcaceae bacterium]|nr:hypothetical protein [Peptococcaceae bacterium]
MDIDCIYPPNSIQRLVKMFDWEKLFPKIVFTQSNGFFAPPDYVKGAALRQGRIGKARFGRR